MQDKPEIIVHLGVHKTATTYLQSRLLNSKARLKKDNISYVKLSSLRENVTSKLTEEKFSKSEVWQFLEPHLDGKLLILSDENILGDTRKPVGGKLYPNARARLELLASIFDGINVSLYLTLREYATYLISRYSESLRHFHFQTFDNYINGIDLDNHGWLQLVADVKAAFPQSNIYCNDFSYFINNEEEYFKRWFGVSIPLEPAKLSPAVRRAKLSLEAYELINEFSNNYSKSQTKALVRFLDAHEQETEKTEFNPFTDSQRRRLVEKYRSDIEEIQKDPACYWIKM
ncbi:hypothetical protein ACNKU7_08410 [Microbulbifer sp. SA54]|uniref:hypothetical protein n=1 Tax=Microbulbifer sp. SA54 TaxID=3401577 RepID=UPI003AAD319E